MKPEGSPGKSSEGRKYNESSQGNNERSDVEQSGRDKECHSVLGIKHEFEES